MCYQSRPPTGYVSPSPHPLWHARRQASRVFFFAFSSRRKKLEISLDTARATVYYYSMIPVKETLQTLSLGAGVQSTTILLMSCAGILPKLDAAIFADTGWESRATYEHLGRLATHSGIHGIPLLKVQQGNLKQDSLHIQVKYHKKKNGQRWGSLPYFTLGPDGEQGMIKRQCTREYKINPLERKQRELLGLKPRQRSSVGAAEIWYGISVDEIVRTRMSEKRWLTFRYPLIYDLPRILGKAFDRWSCTLWLRDNWPHPVPRSACLGCPYHTNDEWRLIRENPEEWKNVVEFDRAIRIMDGMRHQVFLHRDRVPLDQVDLSNEEDHGQLNLFGKCEYGLCGT